MKEAENVFQSLLRLEAQDFMLQDYNNISHWLKRADYSGAYFEL